MMLKRVTLGTARPAFRAVRPLAALRPGSTKASTQISSKTTGVEKSASPAPSLALLLASSSVFSAAAAHAEDTAEAAAAAAASPAAGLGIGEYALLLAPVILYGLFNVYRNIYNPKATFLDFVYLLVFFAIIGNAISIVVFKVRWY